MKHGFAGLVFSFGIAFSAFAQPIPREDVDWGVPPTQELATAGKYHGPTPLTVPGAKTILTADLKKWMESPEPPVVLDVLGGDVKKRRVLPGSVFMGGIAADPRIAPEKFRAALDQATGGNVEKPLVFYCRNAECWMSYNTALRALHVGYKNVYWYRGGWDSWKDAGHKMEKVSNVLDW